jgi:hypothetical protein
VWRVIDRGEGSGDPPDQISFLVVDLAQMCHEKPPLLPLNDIESGNIQVRDAP